MDPEEAVVGESSSSFSSSELSFFVDRVVVLKSVEILCDETRVTEWESSWSVLYSSLSKYQEQPLLLNPSLEEIMTPLCDRLLFLSEKIVSTGSDISCARNCEIKVFLFSSSV